MNEHLYTKYATGKQEWPLGLAGFGGRRLQRLELERLNTDLRSKLFRVDLAHSALQTCLVTQASKMGIKFLCIRISFSFRGLSRIVE